MAKLTIPDEETIATFDVAGTEDTFPFTFAIFAKEDLRVQVGALELEQTDFLLTGTLLEGGGLQGGTVTLNIPAVATTVRIWRDCRPQRSENFGAVFAVPVAALDLALSRQMAVTQDLKRDQAVLEEVAPYLADLPATIDSVLEARDEAVAATASKADQVDLLALGDVVDMQAVLVDDAADDAAQAMLDAADALDAVAGKADQVDLDATNADLLFVEATADNAAIDAADALTEVVNRVDKAGDTMSGPLTSPQLLSAQPVTRAVAGDYGMITAADVPVCMAQGTSTAPITTDSILKPMAYFERHVAGRQSAEPEILLINAATLTTQSVTTVPGTYIFTFTGAGTVTFSGTYAAGPLSAGTYTFTATAGTLTATVSGSVTNAKLRSGLTDYYLDSNWLLSPTMFVHTMVHDGGSNSNVGMHSRVISTGIGTTPTYTGSGLAGLEQVGMSRSVNCLCAYVGTVNTNGIGGGKARPAWAINSEVRWTDGAAPDNLVGMEVDIINSGGKATSHLPSGGNNFTGIWCQSAARNGTSDSDHRAATTAFYVSSDVAYTGWMSAMTVTARIYNHGIYLQNNLAASTAVGMTITGTSWSYGLNIDSPIATAGIRINNTASNSAVGLIVSGAGMSHGATLQSSFTAAAALLENQRNAAGADGLRCYIARGADDALAVDVRAAGSLQFYITGDATNPVRMRLGGNLRRLASAQLGSLISTNDVIYLI